MIKYLLIIFLSISGCNADNTHKNAIINEDLIGIKIIQFFPMVTEKGKLEGYDTIHTEIYYHKDLILYKLSYGFDTLFNPNNINPFHSAETRFHYIVYKKGDAFGIDYDIHKSPIERTISVDSVHRTEWAFNSHIDDILGAPVEIVTAKKENNNNNFHETYLYGNWDGKTKPDINNHELSGTIDLYFTDKLKGIDFSLAPKTDSAKKKKLYRSKVINNKRFWKEGNIYIDAFESNSYLLEELLSIDKEEILGFIDKYKNGYGKNKAG